MAARVDRNDGFFLKVENIFNFHKIISISELNDMRNTDNVYLNPGG